MGEPDAGNPHVRFDEGGGNPAPTRPVKSRRGQRKATVVAPQG
jgi:hypothetical protein